MIAVCPTCHDEIHNGEGISDELLYEWKKIPRNHTDKDIVGHIYVEPATEIRVLAGSMCVATDNAEAGVFTLSNANKFTFKIDDGDIFFASCTIKDLAGAYLVRAFNNYFKVRKNELLTVDQRPGRISVTVLDANKYLPPWTAKIMWRALPDFVHNNQLTVLDIEVVRPGVVRLKGVFVADDAVLAITDDKVYLLRPELNGPLALVGGGEDTIIKVPGPVTMAAFML